MGDWGRQSVIIAGMAKQPRFWFWLAVMVGLGWLRWAPLEAAAAATPSPSPAPTASPSPAPAAAEVLCPPGVYPAAYATDCRPWGPAAALSRLAARGYFFPPDPLPAQPLPQEWFALPGEWQYARVLEESNRALYPSMDDAVEGNHPRHFPPGFIYVSYTRMVYYKHHRLYLVDPRGWWMRGEALWGAQPSKFRGLLFQSTPPRPFGWVVRPVSTHTQPAYGRRYVTHHALQRYQVVQVYDTAQAAGIPWYMIAPDEWVPGTALGLVFPRHAPPPGVSSDRWIEVNLFEQTLAAYDHGTLRFATLVSSGHAPFWTQPGLFQIYKKLQTTQMRGAFANDRSDYYQLEDVPWTMYYDKTRALHGAYWHDMFGYPTSHGCVNLSIADAHWLYEWGRVGDWVYVWDPSGKTPTEGGGSGP